MFRVGQKVVCVDDTGQVAPKSVLGHVYTVSGGRPHLITGEQLIFLLELPTPVLPCGLRGGFRATRFRPAVDRPTDISIFTEMLPRRELERAS